MKKPPVGEETAYGLKRLLLWTLFIQGALLGLTYLGYFLFPLNAPNYWANFVYPPGEPPNGWTPLKTWDGQIYLYLADQGYHPHQFTNAFYPLFPFLVRAAGLLLGGRPLLGGLLLSHLFTLGTVVYLYRLVKIDHGGRTAFFSALFLLAFPTGFYLGLLYTEALFLFLATGHFYYARQNQYGLSAVFAFGLPLTRPTGFLVLLPALVTFWEGGKNGKAPGGRRWMPLAGLTLGAAAYFLAMKAMTGESLSAFEAEKGFISHFDIQNLFHPVHWFIQNFIQVDPALHATPVLLLNRVFFLLFLWTLGFSRRLLDKALFAYCLALGLVPAFAGGMVTYMRYLLADFPLFAALALRLKEREYLYLWASFALQGYFTVQQALNYFVS